MRPKKIRSGVAAFAVLLVIVVASSSVGGVSKFAGLTSPDGEGTTASQAPVRTAAQLEPLPDTILFQDDFDNRRVDGWKAYDSGTNLAPSNWWVMPHGVLAESSNIWGGSKDPADPAKPGTNFIAGNLGWRDIDYSLRIKSDDDDALGVVFRYTGEGSYYRFSMDAERGIQRLVRRSGGRFTTLAERPVRHEVGRWYDLRIRAVGSELSVYLDGELVLDATDSTLPSGAIGLYAWGSRSAYFDDVEVRATITSGFTIAVLPDTQYFTVGVTNDTFDRQTRWIAQERGQRKIAMVLHEGDVVTGPCIPERWTVATRAMSVLEGKVPYAIAPGNHDFIRYARDGCAVDDASRDFDYSFYNAAFPLSRVQDASGESWGGAYPGRASSTKYGGASVRGSSANTYHLLEVGGVRLLVLGIEFGPDQATLDWANDVVKRHEDRTVIVLTHDYLGADGLLRGSKPYHFGVASAPGQLDGVDMWQKLVDQHPNIRIVLNGHTVQCHDSTSATVPNPTTTCTRADGVGHAGRREVTNSKGARVFEMVANYQSMDPVYGNGYLRLLRFNPASRTIDVTTYSPVRGRWLTDPRNQFTLRGVDM